MKVDVPKNGAINREAQSSAPTLVMPPRKTMSRMKRSSAERRTETGAGADAGESVTTPAWDSGRSGNQEIAGECGKYTGWVVGFRVRFLPHGEKCQVREIEIRRHAYTKKGAARGKGTQLSAEGVAFARALSHDMGTFTRVLSSEIPRTLETAVAMGFAVDDSLEVPSNLMDAAIDVVGHHERCEWEQPWARFATLVRQPGPVANLGAWLRAIWEQNLVAVPDGERLLVISHGRTIEIGVIACLTDLSIADFAMWGESLHHGEGIRMSYDHGRFTHPRVIRT